MQKNVVTKTFSTRRSSTGVVKGYEKKNLEKLLVMVLYQKQHTMFMKQQIFCSLLRTEEEL